jgi:hypothetical protein
MEKQLKHKINVNINIEIYFLLNKIKFLIKFSKFYLFEVHYLNTRFF